MRENPEVVRGPAAGGVEVVDVAGVAGRLERGGVLVGVPRASDALHRADTGRVLGRKDEHVAADVVVHVVGERRSSHRRVLSAAIGVRRREPHLDLVAWLRRDGPTELAVVVVVGVAVALATVPFLDRRRGVGPAVDRVVERQVDQRLLGRHGDLLAGPVRDRERVRHEVRGVGPRDRRRHDGVVGVAGRLGDRQHERDVLLELGLDELLVVREDEAARAVLGDPLVVGHRVGRGLAGRHLRREAQGPVLHLRMGVGVAVGRVELGRDVGVIAGYCRVVVRADHGFVDHVVRRRRVDLPADPVEQELRRGVVVDEELEPHVGEQAVQRLGLRLGARARATVGVTGGVRRGALVVPAPLDREVPVQVHAVADGDLAVTVVVAAGSCATGGCPR